MLHGNNMIRSRQGSKQRRSGDSTSPIYLHQYINFAKRAEGIKATKSLAPFDCGILSEPTIEHLQASTDRDTRPTRHLWHKR